MAKAHCKSQITHGDNIDATGENTAPAPLEQGRAPGKQPQPGNSNADRSIAVRLYCEPLTMLIWFGAVATVLGGAISLSDRGRRIRAPTPGKKPVR